MRFLAATRRRLVAAGLVAAAIVWGCGGSAGTSGIPSTSVPASAAANAGSAAASESGSAPSSMVPGRSESATAVGAPSAQPLPRFDHVYVVVLENREFDAIVASDDAPYLNELIANGGLATNFTAVGHPSQPNYLALFAGSTFGVRDDADHDLGAANVADQLESAGRTWHVYAQNLPGPCSTATRVYGNSVDLVGQRGWYVRKHEPAISFTDIAHLPTRCGRITRLDAFDPAAADFELIVPNETNDMHDGSTSQGDEFLRAFVPRVVDAPTFGKSLLVVTFDEGTSDVGGGGRVATVLVSPLIRPGTRVDRPYDHYSLLRTIEDAWGLGCLQRSCDASDLGEFFPR